MAPTRTQNHPGYDTFAPTDSWDSNEEGSYEAERPRLMTYVRKTNSLTTQQRRSMKSRDLLWLDINDITTLNVYRAPNTPEVIDYVTNLTPPEKCLIGGDFNVWHDMFEPGVTTAHRGTEVADWTIRSNVDFVGQPGVATQQFGHVLDLTFSNIPFASTTVRADMQCGLDHETQVTIIPGRGTIPLEQIHYRVPEAGLGIFSGLVNNGMASLENTWRSPRWHK